MTDATATDTTAADAAATDAAATAPAPRAASSTRGVASASLGRGGVCVAGATTPTASA